LSALDQGVVVVVPARAPVVVPFEVSSVRPSSRSVTVDNGLMTVVRCVTETVGGTDVEVLGRAIDVGTLDVTFGACRPIWIAEGTCVAAPPVSVNVIKRTAPTATKSEPSLKPHRVPVKEVLSTRGRTREAADV
jgi:hypothetical protein